MNNREKKILITEDKEHNDYLKHFYWKAKVTRLLKFSSGLKEFFMQNRIP